MTAVIRRPETSTSTRAASLPTTAAPRAVATIAAELAAVLDVDTDETLDGYAAELLYELEDARARQEHTAALRGRLAALRAP